MTDSLLNDRKPENSNFPARPITTQLEWHDLVLDAVTQAQVDDIVAWVRHETILLDDWGLRQRLHPGFRSLFFGPPGTGKRLAATLIGKVLELPLYRIDLARLAAKYIGDTENNLDSLFERAQQEGWILFFDEADALFGRRTEVNDAHDRYANQQTAYLLQRIEDFPGIVILASNLRSAIDEAFARRFQSIIHFALPDAALRLRLWRDVSKDMPVDAAVDLHKLAADHELSGGGIVNVLRAACLQAVQRDPPLIRDSDILTAVAAELRKSGKANATPVTKKPKAKTKAKAVRKS